MNTNNGNDIITIDINMIMATIRYNTSARTNQDKEQPDPPQQAPHPLGRRSEKSLAPPSTKE